MFTVYVLKNSVDKIYIGQTNNLDDRLRRHNAGSIQSTKSGIPWTILHVEHFPSRAEAMKREKALKGGQGRVWIREKFFQK